MHFHHALQKRWRDHDTLLCVGLDPEPARFPSHLRDHDDPVFAFCSAIVAATADLVCAFKPQIAHFAALRAEATLERLVAYIHAHYPGVPVILDAKRGDIASTARYYAAEAFVRYRADAVTLNPYLGRDAAEPFLEHADKGVILLCRTSNPGGSEFQALDSTGTALYLHVAQTIARDWNGNGNCALVVGATWPRELGQVRDCVGQMPLLIPGIGAQDGDLATVLRHGLREDGNGLIVSASRTISYAGNGEDFAASARQAAQTLRSAINQYRQQGHPPHVSGR